MPKGYKLPKSSRPKETMRAGAPKSQKELLSKAPELSSKIPSVRPSWKRNQTSAPGFKPGSY